MVIGTSTGRLEELSLEQRERAICYLLEKLHAFQSSKQQRLIGLGRAFEQALVRRARVHMGSFAV